MSSDVRRPFKERLTLQIAFRRLDSAFEICNELQERDRQSILEEMQKRLRQRMPSAPEGKLPDPGRIVPAKFSDRCRELAIDAPDDEIWNLLIMIAQSCEARADAIKSLDGEQEASSIDDPTRSTANGSERASAG
jgi:hypothetical protein